MRFVYMFLAAVALGALFLPLVPAHATPTSVHVSSPHVSSVHVSSPHIASTPHVSSVPHVSTTPHFSEPHVSTAMSTRTVVVPHVPYVPHHSQRRDYDESEGRVVQGTGRDAMGFTRHYGSAESDATRRLCEATWVTNLIAAGHTYESAWKHARRCR